MVESNQDTSKTNGNDKPRKKKLATSGKKLARSEATRRLLAAIIWQMTVALRRVNAMQGETEFRSAIPRGGRRTQPPPTPGKCQRGRTPTTEESSAAMPYPYTAPESNPRDPGQCKQSQNDIPVPVFPSIPRTVQAVPSQPTQAKTSQRRLRQIGVRIRNAKIQRRILSEGDVPLARVVEIALSMEAAEKNTRIFHVNEPADSVDKIRAEVGNRYNREQKRKCIHCGRLHKDLCRFREATCFRCGKRGHLATICRSRGEHTSERQVSRFLNQRKINQIEDQEEEESVQRMVFMRTYDYRVKYATNDPPYVIKMRVEDTLMTFEIDTGSCLTLISEKDFKRYLPDVQVKEAGIIVKTYDGTVVPILGEIDVKVDFRGTIAKLRAVVVRGERKALLGREWINVLKIGNYFVNQMPLEDTLAELLSEHQVVFGETTDPIKGFTFAVNIQDVNPIFHKARPVPFAIRTAVNEVLERMVEKDYLYQVPSSKWATPVVVVPKKNKEFRICCDFKVTLNRFLDTAAYPLPTQQDLFSVLARGKYFSKLDLSNAYLQLEYLGYLIKEDGIRPLEDKIQGLQKAKSPTNVSELRSFLGLVNYYGKFIPNLPELLEPLHKLLKKNSYWKWTGECEEAISECKRRITSEKVLVPYDATLPLSLATDASQIGVGAVLSHVIEGQENPIMFASRTLSGAERNYSQIEREALAIIYGVTKFHQFIYGRQFTLITDHKPLVSILGPRAGIPTLSTSRLQRWGLTLAAYTYEIKFRRTQDHGNADLLSRLPVESDETPVLNQTFILSYVEDLPVTAAEIGVETKKDEVLSVVKRYTQQGWPERQTQTGPSKVNWRSWVWATRPWQRIHMDFAFKDGVNLLIVVDSHSKWVEAIPMREITARKTIEQLRRLFSAYGLPEEVVSDNGPQFTGVEMKSFFERNGVRQTLIPAYHPQSNGLAERAVQLIKMALEKNKRKFEDTIQDTLSRILLTYRCTPHETTGKTPSELFMGRSLRTRLTLIHQSLDNRVRERQARQMRYDRGRGQVEFEVDDKVWCKNFRGVGWIPGRIVGRKGSRVYTVLINGQVKTYHRDQIRRRWTSGEEGDEAREKREEEDDPIWMAPESMNSRRDRESFSSETAGLPQDPVSGDQVVEIGSSPRESACSSDKEARTEERPLPRRNPPRDRRPPVRYQGLISFENPMENKNMDLEIWMEEVESEKRKKTGVTVAKVPPGGKEKGEGAPAKARAKKTAQNKPKGRLDTESQEPTKARDPPLSGDKGQNPRGIAPGEGGRVKDRVPGREPGGKAPLVAPPIPPKPRSVLPKGNGQPTRRPEKETQDPRRAPPKGPTKATEGRSNIWDAKRTLVVEKKKGAEGYLLMEVIKWLGAESRSLNYKMTQIKKGDREDSARGRNLEDLIISHGLEIWNDWGTPTFSARNGESVIDLTLYRGIGLVKDSWRAEFTDASDHKLISFTAKSLEIPVSVERTPSYSVRGANIERFLKKFNTELENDLELAVVGDGQDRAVDGLHLDIITTSRGLGPGTGTVLSFKRKKQPWWSDDLEVERKRIRALRKRAQRCIESERKEKWI
ncbi:K02A2.6-like, partial [Cordylochernes scorpioides]